MDTRYYLAVDIGASSGRHMLSHMENGKPVLEEIYRFPNGMTEKKMVIRCGMWTGFLRKYLQA